MLFWEHSFFYCLEPLVEELQSIQKFSLVWCCCWWMLTKILFLHWRQGLIPSICGRVCVRGSCGFRTLVIQWLISTANTFSLFRFVGRNLQRMIYFLVFHEITFCHEHVPANITYNIYVKVCFCICSLFMQIPTFFSTEVACSFQEVSALFMWWVFILSVAHKVVITSELWPTCITFNYSSLTKS